MSSTPSTTNLGSSTYAALSVITLRPGGQVISVETLGRPSYLEMVSQLHQSLGVLVIGLMLVAISFWQVCVKAVQYAARANADSDGRGTKATVACLLTLNLVQFGLAVYKVYRSVVLDFGDLFKLLDNDWSIPIQILVTAMTACVAQGFFTHRLHTMRRNQFINKSTILLIVTQFTMAIVSVARIFQEGYGAIMIEFGGDFSIYAMFGLSVGIDVALASVLYLFSGTPTTFREKLQYWTFESLTGCGVLSLFAAVMLGLAGLDLVWLVTTFVLGNLYTLSVLLSLLSTPTPSQSAKRRSQSKLQSSRSGVSTPTLTNDVEGRRGVDIEVQPMHMDAPVSPAAVPAKKSDSKLEYVLGYHSGDAAV